MQDPNIRTDNLIKSSAPQRTLQPRPPLQSNESITNSPLPPKIQLSVESQTEKLFQEQF